MFIAGTPDWSVRTLDHENDVMIYTVWDCNGMIGVAGGNDGLAELFVDVVCDYEKALARLKLKGKQPVAEFAVLATGMNRRKRPFAKQLVATIVDDDPTVCTEDDTVGKPSWGDITKHHVVLKVLKRGRRWTGRA